MKRAFEREQRLPQVCSFCLLLTSSRFPPGLPWGVKLPLSQPCHEGHIVLAQTLFHPLLPGPPTRWADVSLADAGVAELSWNRFRRAVGLAWREVLWPGQQAKSQAGRQGPGPPNTGLPKLQMATTGLVWEGTDIVLLCCRPC